MVLKPLSPVPAPWMFSMSGGHQVESVISGTIFSVNLFGCLISFRQGVKQKLNPNKVRIKFLNTPSLKK